MTKNKSLRGLSVAALAATALFAAQPAAADVIEINNFWADAGYVTLDFTGTNWHDGSTVTGLHESGGAGGFLTYNQTTDPGQQSPFQSFCVDIFHSFGFAVASEDTLQPASIISAEAAADLGQLYTNHHNEIDSMGSSATNESAFQLAVWEIVNENSGAYNIGAGDFMASGTGSSLAQAWLNELSTPSASDYVANIWTVQSMLTTGHGYAQDVVVFAPVPEPQTYAMMLVGLGLLGFSARRKNQNLG
ncbi:MAG: PEP-CTERM sorting domain-containing protein [Nitrosomonadales bacterium]|nr:PEP-CTERM sorting domain-containing protein [Nitrosomonadales bacterium]